MKKPRKARRDTTTQVTPIIAVLMPLIADGHALLLTFGPACA